MAQRRANHHQAEHAGLFLEAANRTKFIGSPTSPVPPGIRVGMTGHDVRHADGRQLQRMGLKLDVRVDPTIAGVAAGKDEVLDRAIAFVLNGR